LENLIKAIILGVVQGLTEWLPISSTGHLKLFENLLVFSVPILFDVFLHVGTLIVVLTFFRREIGEILSALVRLDFKTEDGKMIPLIIVGATPTVLIGLVFGETIENTFQSLLPIAIAFIVCGLILHAARAGKEKTEKISYSVAIAMGIAQGIAIIPGISRSGATIATALLLGIKREKAFRFSFLLSIPAVMGALALTIGTEFGTLATRGLGWTEILAGAAIAMLTGYFALKLLWKILLMRKLPLFAFYCWLLGAVLIALVTLGILV